jgi:hypothetical protein
MDVCQDKVKTMEIELDEEKSSVELLNDRIARSREQVLYFNTHTLEYTQAGTDFHTD